MRLLRGLLWAALFVLLHEPALACSLPLPENDIVLRIDGQIQHCNVGLEVHLDLSMLETLPKREFRTVNPWEPGAVVYQGVLLRDLMDYVGARGGMLNIGALNDYSADMPMADAREIDVILAYRRNGELMPVRGKGPLFVVFPFSDQPALATEDRYAQSVWQVSRITVK